jgi:hypothetical protein
MVFKGHGKSEESSSVIPKPQAAKFLAKPRSGNSQCAPSTNSSTTGMQEYAKLNEMDVQVCAQITLTDAMKWTRIYSTEMCEVSVVFPLFCPIPVCRCNRLFLIF